MKPKVYMVVTVHTVGSSQTSHTLNLEDHISIQKDGAVKTNLSVF